MKLRQKIGVFFGILVVALGIMVSVASPASARPLGPYRIVSLDKCLDVIGGVVSTYNGAGLQLYDCLPSQYNQRFYLNPVSGSYGNGYQIVAAHSGRCLDVEGVALYGGARIQQYDCLGPNQTNQVFLRTNYQGGVYQLVAVHSFRCVTAIGYYNGADVIQGSREGGPNSWWTFLDPI